MRTISLGTFSIFTVILVTLSTRIGNLAAPVAYKGPPKEAAYDHYIRLKVVKVTEIEQMERVRILELTVRRWYGKIDGKSLKRNQEHETQEFKIVFPAAPKADVKPGDIIDYRIVGYLPKATGDE